MIRLSAWRRADRIPSSAVVWRGRSLFDGSPLVAIVTGLHGDSKNAKTGAGLAQLFILVEDWPPVRIRSGRIQRWRDTKQSR